VSSASASSSPPVPRKLLVPPTLLHAPLPRVLLPAAAAPTAAKPRRPKEKREKERRRHGLGGAAREENGEAKPLPRGGCGRGGGGGREREGGHGTRGARAGGAPRPRAPAWRGREASGAQRTTSLSPRGQEIEPVILVAERAAIETLYFLYRVFLPAQCAAGFVGIGIGDPPPQVFWGELGGSEVGEEVWSLRRFLIDY
jgi:hypothetical protein